MPRDGSGGYTAPQNGWNPAINGAQATPDHWQAILNDLVAAIQASIAADGQTPITGILNFQNNRISNAGAPIGQGDVLRWEQLIKGSDIPSATSIAIPVEGSYFSVTGSATITTIQDRFPGRAVCLSFDAGITLTHSATLIMPDGASVLTQADDVAAFINDSSGVWRCISYPRLKARRNGDGTQNFDVASLNGGQLGGRRNKVINGAFQINQRSYGSGAATSAGQYTLDRFKVTGVGGFTYSAAAGKTTVTIPGVQTLQQVIEGANLPAGDYVLSWEGTAQGRINGGPYGLSGLVTAALAGGVSATIEFKAGTLANVQLEPGTIATPFEHPILSVEESLCRRYYRRIVEAGYKGTYSGAVSSRQWMSPNLLASETMRVTPTYVPGTEAVFTSDVSRTSVTSANLSVTLTGLTAGAAPDIAHLLGVFVNTTAAFGFVCRNFGLDAEI